jgi:hypothetical protein
MSNHSSYAGPPPEYFGKYKDPKLGATGQFPEGKITEEDEGEIRIAIGHQPGKVIMDFGEKPIKWIGFNPVQTRQIAILLIEHANECLIVKA